MDLTLGDRIRLLRTRLRKSQAEFAEILGSQQTSVSRYEQNKVMPGISFLWKLRNLADPDEREGFEAEIKKQAGAAILSMVGVGDQLGEVPVGGTMDDIGPALTEFAEMQELKDLIAAGRGAQASLIFVVRELSRDKHPEPALLEILVLWVQYRKQKGASKILYDTAALLRERLTQRFGEIPRTEATVSRGRRDLPSAATPSLK